MKAHQKDQSNICFTNVNQEGSWININIKQSQKIHEKMMALRSELNSGKIKLKNPHIFESFSNRGKQRYIKYSYDQSKQIFSVHLQKTYFFKMLGYKIHDIAYLAKNLGVVWDQYIEQVKYFIKNMIESDRKQQGTQLISVDMLAITITKQTPIMSVHNKKIMRRYYLRQSNFEFRSSIPNKPREQQYLFAVIYEDYEPGSYKQRIPSDQQYYNSSRLNFLDDLHTNQSLVRRFVTRFVPFHQAFTLYDRKIQLSSNRYIRQFYRKCVNQSYYYGMRLKKLGFSFPMKRLMREKEVQKEKSIRFSVYMYIQEQANKYYDNTEDIIQKNYFSIETYYPDVSDKIINQVFLKRLKSLDFGQDDEQIFQGIIGQLRKKILIRPKNQIAFCRILTEFTFFIDRIFFRLMESKDKRKASSYSSEYQLSLGPICEDTVILRLPSSEEFTLSQSKYNHFYAIEIKSNGIRKTIDTVKKQIRDIYSYETQVAQIKMIRKKKAHPDETEKQHDFFSKHPSDFRGLKIYLNSLLNAWNSRQIYQDVVDFSSYYLNIVTEKLKDKVVLKNIGRWSAVIGGMQALIQSLTQGFNTQCTTIKLYITQGFEDNKQGTEPGFTSDLNQTDCIMTMTFNLFQLTKGGWRIIIYPCTFFFKIYKQIIQFKTDRDQRLAHFQIDVSKKKMQSVYKEQLRNIYGSSINIPANYYELDNNP